MLFVITTLDFGGTESFLDRLVRGLDRSRFEPEILSLVAPGRIGEALERDGFRVDTLNLSPRARLAELPGGAWHLARHVARRRIDLVQSLLYRANVLATVALLPRRLFRRGPLLVTGQRSLRPAGRARDAAAQRLTRRHADRVVAVSEAVRRQLLATEPIDADRVVVIQNGVDVDRFRPADDAERARRVARDRFGLPRDARIVGAVGRLHEPKGLVHLIEAGTCLAPSAGPFDDLHLVLAGDGPERGPLEQRIAALGLGDRVHLLGYLGEPEALLPALDVYVLPSLAEGSPNALLEAMAAGLPAVASDVGGVPEAIVDGEHGLLVPPADPRALADAIARLLDDDALRRRLAEAGRRRVERELTLDAMIRRHESLYLELLDGR